MTETEAPLSSKPDSKTAWRKRNDAGPHTGVFPSGATLKFIVPNSGLVLLSGKLTGTLRATAVFCAGHPGGNEGYMRDLVNGAVVNPELAEQAIQAIEDGLALRPILVAEMLVDPKVTPEEVAAGDFPEEDIRMLLEFAERRRNVDAAGNQLPIIVARDWLPFRDKPESDAGARNGGPGEHQPRGDVPDADAGPV